MYAGICEERHIENVGWLVMKELSTKTIFFRYMDDVVHVVRGKLSRGARKVLQRLQRARSFGPGLNLLRTSGGEAFGFD